MHSGAPKPVYSGMPWSERAQLGELDAVLYAGGPKRENLMMHAAGLFGAKVALGLSNNKGRRKGLLIDFGCGTGRMLRFFCKHGYFVIGTEITAEMLSAARLYGLPKDSGLCLTDGVHIPLRGQTVDMIWVCGVLKYSLFPPGSPCRHGCGLPKTLGDTCYNADLALDRESFIPVYRAIAREMYRVLKPGGIVVNLEMYVDTQPDIFVADFEQVGFVTKQVRVLRRYLGRLERFCQRHRWPSRWVLTAGYLIAALRYWLDNPRRTGGGFRDYLFVWSKPRA